MPRALSEQERCRQCQKLLEKGKAIVLSQGIRKVSVDDITSAAGMAKGTFYQHFESKEQYLYELTEQIHRQIFSKAEQAIISAGDLQSGTREFLRNLFNMPEMVFFTQNFNEINDLLESVPDNEALTAKQMEADMFEKLLTTAGIDTQKVKTGVVYNYVHALYLIKGSELMIDENLDETVELIMDSLISYIFGGTQ